MSTIRKQLAVSPFGRLQTRVQALDPRWVLAALVVIYAIFLSVAMAYKSSYWGQGFDQVDYELAIWNTTQGRFLGVSRYNFTDTFLGLDVALGFLVAVPFYALWPSVYTLDILQSVLLALAAVPVYLIAHQRFGSRWAGVGWAATYLLFPTLQFVNMTAPFQARVPAILLFFWAFYFFQRRWLWAFLGALFVAMFARTDAALVVVAFGLYALVSRRNWRWFVPPLLVGLVYFYVAISYISPAFYTTGFSPGSVDASVNAGQDYNDCWPCGSAQIGYYSHLGDNLPDIVVNMATHPVQVLQLIFEPLKVRYLVLMFGTLLFLPLFAPKELLIAAPVFAINLLSTRVYQYTLREQYQALIIPGIVIAGIYGGAWLWDRVRGSREQGTGDREQGTQEGANVFPLRAGGPRGATQHFKLGAGLLLAQVLLVGLINIPVKNPVVSALRNPEDPARVAVMREMAALIPPNASVAATSFLAPPLIPRQEIYYIPGGQMHHQIDEAEYAFIDERAQVLQGTGIIERLRTDPRWQVVEEKDDLILLRQDK